MQERLTAEQSSKGTATPNLAEPQDAATSDPAAPDQSSPELTTDVSSTAKAAAARVDEQQQQQQQQQADPQASLASQPDEAAQQLQSGLAAVEDDLGQLQAGADQAAGSPDAEGELEPAEDDLEAQPLPTEIRYQADQAGLLAEEAAQQAQQQSVPVGDELVPRLLTGSQPAADQQPGQPQEAPVLIDLSADLDRYLEHEEEQQQQQVMQLPPVGTGVDALPTQSSSAAQPELSERPEAEELRAVDASRPATSLTGQPDAPPEDVSSGSPLDLEKPGEDGTGPASRPAGLPSGLRQGMQEESEVVTALRRQVHIPAVLAAVAVPCLWSAPAHKLWVSCSWQLP